MKPEPVSSEEFEKHFQFVCNWGIWGEDDEKGTLNYIRPCHIIAAALVQSGRTVSLSIPLSTVAGQEAP